MKSSCDVDPVALAPLVAELAHARRCRTGTQWSQKPQRSPPAEVCDCTSRREHGPAPATPARSAARRVNPGIWL